MLASCLAKCVHDGSMGEREGEGEEGAVSLAVGLLSCIAFAWHLSAGLYAELCTIAACR